jgi:phospholipid N-methyltransferase
MIKDNFVFLKEFIVEFQTTGSCFPTSKKAASELTVPLRGRRTPKRILELGPGTGSVTFPIIESMIPGDTLSICEINPRFMRELKTKLEKNATYQKFKSQINFYECPIQEFPESDQKFDVIVCSLPFLNFDRPMVEDIFAKLTRLSTQNAVMTYYQYIGLRSIGKNFGSKEVKQRMCELDSFFDSTSEKHQSKRKRVWLNMLPINVYTLQLAA